jgi:hypothetical protein
MDARAQKGWWVEPLMANMDKNQDDDILRKESLNSSQKATVVHRDIHINYKVEWRVCMCLSQPC